MRDKIRTNEELQKNWIGSISSFIALNACDQSFARIKCSMFSREQIHFVVYKSGVVQQHVPVYGIEKVRFCAKIHQASILDRQANKDY